MSCNLVFAGNEICTANPSLPLIDGSVVIPAQKFPYHKGKRTIRVYLYYPKGKLSAVNSTTGLLLTLHNWEGRNAIGAPSPKVLSSRYNTICIAVDYLQSGAPTVEPYDFGYLQSLDALRALYYVWSELNANGINFSQRRIYCSGGSGGGNVTQMANKFAPRTFACIVDISGMASLTDDIAYNLPGGSILNARYSKDPESPAYLEKHMQEIRDIGNPIHLAMLKKMGNNTKIVVVHGVDDKYCLVSDKKRVVANMRKAGLDIDAHFLEEKDVDGKLITGTGHACGDRTAILIHFADKYLSEKSADMKKNGKTDFEIKGVIHYPTSNGYYSISYANGYPVGKFIPEPGYTPKKRSPMEPIVSTYKVQNGAFPWYDKSKGMIINLPESLAGETVPLQWYSVSTKNTLTCQKSDAVTIGVFEKDLPVLLKRFPHMIDTHIEFDIQRPNGEVLKYTAVIYPNAMPFGHRTGFKLSAGLVLLKMHAVKIKAEN